MKKRLLLNLIMLALALAILPHCGGGGGGSNGPSGPTTAVLTLSTALTPTGVMPQNTVITDYNVTITLPAGVTLKSTNTPTVDSSVLVASGAAAGSDIIGTYTPAAGGTPGTVDIYVANGSGFSYGEFCKLTCTIAAGYNPSASDFTETSFSAGGLVTSPSLSTVPLTGILTLTGTL